MMKVLLNNIAYIHPVDGPACWGYSNQEYTLDSDDATLLIDEGIAEEVKNDPDQINHSASRGSGNSDRAKRIPPNRQLSGGLKNPRHGKGRRSKTGRTHKS